VEGHHPEDVADSDRRSFRAGHRRRRVATKTIRGRSYTAELVDNGGQRALEVTSDFHDRFVLDFLLCNADDPTARILREAQGGCADESCTDVPYDGQINVEVTTGSSTTKSAVAIADVVTVRDTLRTATAAGNDVILRTVHRQPNGEYRALITVQDETRSTQTLIGLLPGEWIKSATDRKIAIQVPPPFAVKPSQVTLTPSGIQQFSATERGQPATKVTWSATVGTIDKTGKFTAGSTLGTFQVRAKHSVDRRGRHRHVLAAQGDEK
jgi:hypothetical protein